MMQKHTCTELILTIAVVAAAMGIAAEAQAPEGALRATILLPEQPQEIAPLDERDACMDLYENVALALTAPAGASLSEYQAAYERIKEKARPSIPVDERILTLFAKNEAGRICDAGCGVVEFSAHCRRSALQTMEDCVQQGNILACEVRYDCSVSCAPLPPEPVSLPVEPEEPSWFAPLSNVFERFTEPEKEERIDEIIPVPLESARGGAEGDENVAPKTLEREAPEAPIEVREESIPPPEEKQRHEVPQEQVTEPQPESALPPVEEAPLPVEETKEQIALPKQSEQIPSELSPEEWKQRWDEYWGRWERGEENLGPPPELPAWLPDGSTQWQENMHSEQPPECIVCAQFWAEQWKKGTANPAKPQECTVCEQYWQKQYQYPQH